MKKEEIYQKALDKWGVEAQCIILLEEMAELQIEIIMSIRRGASLQIKDAIIREMADVEIMLEQMKLAFTISEAELSYFKEEKLKRLKRRLGIKDGVH